MKKSIAITTTLLYIAQIQCSASSSIYSSVDDEESLRSAAESPALAAAPLPAVARPILETASLHNFEVHTPIVEDRYNPPFSADTRFNRAEGTGALIDDYLNAIKTVQKMEKDIVELRHGDAINIENKAKWKDTLTSFYKTVSHLADAGNAILIVFGSASIITDTALGLRVVLLCAGTLQAIYRITTKLEKSSHDEAEELRAQVNKKLEEMKRVAAAKRDELVRRGVDIDSIDRERPQEDAEVPVDPEDMV